MSGSKVSAEIDLSGLAVDRTSSDPTSARRKWISRYLVPGAILIGFTGLLGYSLRDAMTTRVPVSVISVLVEENATAMPGRPLFQAAGWIEPRPSPVNVSALATGVIEEVLVVEGQTVRAGEMIARLVSIDADILVQQAKASLEQAKAEHNRAMARRDAARTRLQNPVHLQVRLADAKSELARIQTELSNLPYLIETAGANRDFAKKNFESKKAAGRAVSGLQREKAEAELAAAESKVRELKQRFPSLKKEEEAVREKVEATLNQLELMVEEKREVSETEAAVAAAMAKVEFARVEVQKAELQRKRTQIVAPIDGRILRRFARPGSRVTGMNVEAEQHASLVVQLYEPSRLQVRADVRLENVPQVLIGQPVEIETSSSPTKLKGRVLQINSSANIQKNTLEVKVELIEPPDTVRPEMLVTATFLSLGEEAGVKESQQHMLVPAKLVQREGESCFTWIVDADGQACKQAIEISFESSDEWVAVSSGLKVTDKLIASDTGSLVNGQAVRID